MPRIEATREIDASPETIWRVVASYHDWPHWSPLFQHVGTDTPEFGMTGEWTLHGLIGHAPYNGLFRVERHHPVEALVISSIRVTSPYDFVRHTILLERSSPARLTWRIDYTASGGPGGWIVDRLIIRRRAPELLERTMDALTREISGSQNQSDRSPETARTQPASPR